MIGAQAALPGLYDCDERAAAPHGLVLEAEQVPGFVRGGLGDILGVAVAQAASKT